MPPTGYKYLRIAHQGHAVADRKERSHLLNDMEVIAGLNRKTLIRRMNRSRVRKRHRRLYKTGILRFRCATDHL